MSKKNPYKSLKDILNLAYLQASEGKGKERHASGEPFEDQPICSITRKVGIGFCLGQALKKIEESTRLSQYPGREIGELLGAINYIAGAIIVINERAKERASGKPTPTL
jgi:hypothetical protein